MLDSRSFLASLVGASITSFRRVFYVFRGEIDRSEGAIEISLSGGRVVFLDSGSDGEELRVSQDRWCDPFEGRMSRENIEFVEKSGKYSAFCVDSEEPYASLVGKTIGAVIENELPDGRISGVVFLIDGIRLSVNTIADELIIDWG